MRKFETTQATLSPPRPLVLFKMGTTDLEKGQCVELPGERIAEVLSTWTGKVGDMPAMILELATDPACRTFSGMVLCMTCEEERTIDSGEPISAIVLKELGNELVRAGKVPRIRA